MLVKESIINPEKYFNLNGLEYEKGEYTLFYNNRFINSSGDLIKENVNVGIRSKYLDGRVLVHPTPIKIYTDGSTNFTSLDDLVLYLSGILSIPLIDVEGGIKITQKVSTFNDLIDGSEEGQLSYVEDSQGTPWLPLSLGGTYYPSGWYVWDGLTWVSDRNAIASQIETNILEINNINLSERIEYVKQASDIVDKILDPTKIYFVDGVVDLGSGQIRVPEQGLNLKGHTIKVSKFISSEDNYEMFVVDPNGSYSGSLNWENLTFTTSGVNSKVLNLFNNNQTDNENNNIDWINVNFVGCTSIGRIGSYRQGFWDVGSSIFSSEGLELYDLWTGGFRITSNRSLNGSSNPLIKAGSNLIMQGRFITDVFYTATNPNAIFCDFSPVNIQNDGDFQIIGGDFGGAVNSLLGHFPNMPINNKKAFYDSNGIEKTNVGGKILFSTTTLTPLPNVNTYVKALGTTIPSNLQWTITGGLNNRLQYDSNEDFSGRVIVPCTLEGGTGDIVGAAIYFWDESQQSFTLLDEAIAEIPFFGTASITLVADVEVNKGDFFELRVKNQNDTTGVSVVSGSKYILSKR